MITTKEELREYIAADNSWYKAEGMKNKLVAMIAHYPGRQIKQYLRYLRKQEYYINTACGNKFKGILGVFYERKKNKLGERLNIDIAPNCFGKGLQIYHGGIVVNSKVRAGENCRLHGGNCIGNKGYSTEVPCLGDTVDIGYGAVLIGGIYVADNCVVGVNAVVNRSFEEDNCVIVGIPARAVKK